MLVPFPLLNAQGIGLSREVDVALTTPMFLLARPKHCAVAAPQRHLLSFLLSPALPVV